MLRTSEDRPALKNKPKEECAEPANRQDTATSRPADRQLSSAPGGARLTPTMMERRSTRFTTFRTSLAVALSLLCGAVAADQGNGPTQLRSENERNADGEDRAADRSNSPTQLRRFIDRQVGGIEKLIVPALDSDLPQPQRPDGLLDPRFQTTEAKRYLGKLLFFDPVRTARILPEFGGVPSTKQTGSCGSCHLGEVASRAGTILNLNVGAEGRGFTDASGRFIPRRRILPGVVDTIPTLTEICAGSTSLGCAAPTHGLNPAADMDALVQSGRADAVDSVPRNVPSIIGAVFNNRLLLGGLAGDPAPPPIGVNPDGNPTVDNVAEATQTVHRMFQLQSAELQKVPSFVKLFEDAFPEEAAMASASSNLNLLINDNTIFRAMGTFMRTVVTRNTPWDRFLAGDNDALTGAQRRGARLFFTPASAALGETSGGGCVSCHSGPALNKQLGDEAGLLVEQNFFNIGLGDHPLQALNASVLGDPRHRDRGRMDVTLNASDEFEFRVVTMRQLRDGLLFAHDGSFTNVRDVVQYFNAGIPRDAEAGAARTLSRRFTNPRGPTTAPGLGLSAGDVDDLTDFLENSLYDPAFVKFNPNSTTKTFQPNTQDLTYSIFRPDLAALGAVDGLMPSGLPMSVNDALSRRDMGLEFLDVTPQAAIARINSDTGRGGRQRDVYRITNNSTSIIDTHLLIVAGGLGRQIQLENGSGTTSTGDPYLRVYLPNGVLLPGQSLVTSLIFRPVSGDRHRRVRYSLGLLSGQGNP